MSNNLERGKLFFEACETGKGWDGCKAYSHPDATFSAQAAAYGVFYGTHTEAGGPVDATGKSVEADYVYVMQFEDGAIRHMTKIWNDVHSLQQIGWA